MRLINSDSQVVDVAEARDRSSASASGIHINVAAIAFIPIFALVILGFVFARDAQSEARHTRELLTVQSNYWRAQFELARDQQRRTEKSADNSAMEARINEQTLMELKPRVDLLEKRYAKQ